VTPERNPYIYTNRHRTEIPFIGSKSRCGDHRTINQYVSTLKLSQTSKKFQRAPSGARPLTGSLCNTKLYRPENYRNQLILRWNICYFPLSFETILYLTESLPRNQRYTCVPVLVTSSSEQNSNLILTSISRYALSLCGAAKRKHEARLSLGNGMRLQVIGWL
jgi:hypothetical protein